MLGGMYRHLKSRRPKTRPADFAKQIEQLHEMFSQLDIDTIGDVFTRLDYIVDRTVEALLAFDQPDISSIARQFATQDACDSLRQTLQMEDSLACARFHTYTEDPTKVLGKGAFGIVISGRHAVTGAEVAIKKMAFVKYGANFERQIRFVNREIDYLKQLKSPNIMKMYHSTKSETEICASFTLVLELAAFPLTKCIEKKKMIPDVSRAPFARKFMLDMVNALKCMHQLGIAHRDLKPDNVLLGYSVTETDLERGDHTHLHFLLCDLGLSRQQSGSDIAVTTMRVGTLKYMAPEIELWNGEDKELDLKPSDIWGLGVIFFEVLSGSWISEHVTTEGALKKFLRGFVFEKVIDPKLLDRIREVSADGLHLASLMLVADYTKRCTLEDILAHPFMKA